MKRKANVVTKSLDGLLLVEVRSLITSFWAKGSRRGIYNQSNFLSGPYGICSVLWDVCEGEYLSAEKCIRKHTRVVKLASLASVLCLDNFLSFSHYFNTGIDLRRIKAVSLKVS